ncbi:MAG: VIT family protein [Deltaproteobacteria bacterium]|nr:VIT family protein [Deltaproteobacteria bacterium]
MSPTRSHRETHFSHRAAWLRAMVLGANDGIVSTACLLLGVAAVQGDLGQILVAGLAGLVAGALSMAVGELVSVGSQRDTELADVAKEERELAAAPERELEELVQIYVAKGLDPELARTVAAQLTAKGALAIHLAEELSITEQTRARPLQAALSSAAAFALGAALPLVAVGVAPAAIRAPATIVVSLVALGTLGALGARLGGAPLGRALARVVIGGAAAMAITMGISALVGQSLG